MYLNKTSHSLNLKTEPFLALRGRKKMTLCGSLLEIISVDNKVNEERLNEHPTAENLGHAYYLHQASVLQVCFVSHREAR